MRLRNDSTVFNLIILIISLLMLFSFLMILFSRPDRYSIEQIKNEKHKRELLRQLDEEKVTEEIKRYKSIIKSLFNDNKEE